MQSTATSVADYLAQLPADRREALQAVREAILKNLPTGYAEGMQYGMIGYFVPHSVYPPGYHCDPQQPLPFVSLASQKNYMSLYLMCLYSDREHEARFREAWAKTGKKLDMGKSCIRFKKLDDIPLPLIGQTIKRVSVKQHIKQYELALKATADQRAGTAAKAKTVKKPAPAKKSAPAKKRSPKKH